MNLSTKLGTLTQRLGRSKRFRKARKLLADLKRKNTGRATSLRVDIVALVTDEDGNVLEPVTIDSPVLISRSTVGAEMTIDTTALDALVSRPILLTEDVEQTLRDMLDEDVSGGNRLTIELYDHT